MKTLLTTATLAIATTLLSANAFASDSQYKLDVFNLTESAIVKVTENGKPVAGVPVEVEGQLTRTLVTSDNGTVIVSNNANHSRTYNIKVTEPSGNVVSTKRLISQYN